MHPFQKHYYKVVQRDLVLSDNLSTVGRLPKPRKLILSLGGNSSEESYAIAAIAALNIITGQKPYLTQQKPVRQKIQSSREVVGGKLVLRGSKMYNFLYKLLFDVLPRMRQFEGLQLPAHENVYCFVLKDVFVFEELVPLFPYFEELGSFQCQFHFTTKNKAEVAVLGNSMQLCFLPS